MTEYLKSVLDEQATAVAFKSPHLEAIAHAGDRRIRQRRVAALAGVVVFALVAGTVAVSAWPGSRVTPNVGNGPPGTVSWAAGSTIHAGPDTIEVGHVVNAFVRTSLGFAVVDDTDNVYSVTAQGVTQIGHVTATLPNNTDQQRLVSDPRGTLVGWVGEDPPGTLTMYTHDQATGRTRSYPSSGGSEPDALFFAIDDRTGYWRTSWNVYAVDLDTGVERLIKPGPAYDFEVYSVEDGVLAFSPNADTTFFAGRSVEEARQLRDFSTERPTGSTDPVRLSPTGSWLSFGAARLNEGAPGKTFEVTSIPEVYDTTTGERITLRLPGDPKVALPAVWLDDVTLQVVAGEYLVGADPDPQLTMYTCSLPAGSCQLAATIDTFTDANPMVLPDGRWYGQR